MFSEVQGRVGNRGGSLEGGRKGEQLTLIARLSIEGQVRTWEENKKALGTHISRISIILNEIDCCIACSSANSNSMCNKKYSAEK